jgi:hypothetical protein
MFDASIAAALGNINAAVIVQQLNYWMNKDGVGTVINGVKYVYNTFVDWVNQQFPWLSVWQFRKAMSLLRSLGIVKVIRHKEKQWNQTNYYSLNCDRLGEFLGAETSRSTEMVEMRSNTDRGEGYPTLEMSNSEVSLYEPKITTKEKTAEQKNKFAAASTKTALEKEKEQKQSNPHSEELNTSIGQKNSESQPNKQNIGEEKTSIQVDYIVNAKWEKLIPLLDSTGIPINKTVTSLLKLYSREKVESAVALLKARKRDSHIPNVSGYFVSALKGDWGSKTLVEGNGDRDSETQQIDKATVFRHWYDLARELGYCSGQQIREGEQWICISGSWELWEAAVKRGYSLDYLKKIMKRNQGQ